MKNNPVSDKELVLFVLDQIDGLGAYLRNVAEYDFYNNSMLKDACFTKLLVIGEYTKRISEDIKAKYPEVRWAAIAKARNFYAHGYGMTEWTQVWETLNIEIPQLREVFQVILNDL